ADLVLQSGEGIMEGLLVVHCLHFTPDGGEESVRVVQVRPGPQESVAQQLGRQIGGEPPKLGVGALERERHVLILLPAKCARRMDEPPSGTDAPQRRLEDFPLLRGKAHRVLLAQAEPQVGTAAKRAQLGAGNVGEDRVRLHVPSDLDGGSGAARVATPSASSSRDSSFRSVRSAFARRQIGPGAHIAAASASAPTPSSRRNTASIQSGYDHRSAMRRGGGKRGGNGGGSAVSA